MHSCFRFKTPYRASLRCHLAKQHAGELPYKCTECDQGFNTQGSLNQHVKRRHPKDTDTAMCSECGKVFKTHDAVVNHARTMHPKHNFVFECKVCHQVFKDIQGMHRHVLLHSDQEFFKCTMCGKTFKNEPAGSTHKNKVHGGQAKIIMQGGPEVERLRANLVLKRPAKSDDFGNKPFKRFRGSVADTINATFNAQNTSLT